MKISPPKALQIEIPEDEYDVKSKSEVPNLDQKLDMIE
jgi:hypothetical protein